MQNTLAPLLPDASYHIYNHANGDENLFRRDENYYFFLQKYAHYVYPIADTYAYCLMPNHFHLMVKIRSYEELITIYKSKKKTTHLELEPIGEVELSTFVSQQFGHLFNTYTQAFNKMYERKGSLFRHRFKRKEINNEAYFTQLIAYIHLNPVKHGFCKNIDDWQHSSFHAYLHQKESKINRQYLLDWFGNETVLKEFHKGIIIDQDFFD